MIVLKKAFGALAKITLLLFCSFSLISLLWILISSLKTNRELFGKPWSIFANPQWENYKIVWDQYRLSENFGNSLYLVFLSVIEILVISTPAAYVLSRTKFFGSKVITNTIIFGMGVPFQLILIPLYFSMYNLGMVNSLLGLSLVYCALSIPFTVFLLMGFFKTLPGVLSEAAFIDGCSPIQNFLLIMLPLGMPGIITAAIFNFVSLWNEFLLALTFLNNDKLFTIPVGLFGLQTSMQYTGKWTALFAGLIIVTVPTMIVYMFLSKQIIAGLTMGAVKE